MFALILVAAVFGLANGQILMSGQCSDTVPVVNAFNATRYLGTWYEIYAHPQQWEADLTCITAKYSVYTASSGDGGSDLVVNNTGLLLDKTTNQRKMVINIGNATAISPGKLEVQFPDINNNPPSPYWVLDTNYVSYSLVYACRNSNATHRLVSSWILSRSQNLLSTDILKVSLALSNSLVTSAGLSWENYIVNDHTKEGCSESGASLATFTIFMVLVSYFVSKLL